MSGRKDHGPEERSWIPACDASAHRLMKTFYFCYHLKVKPQKVGKEGPVKGKFINVLMPCTRISHRVFTPAQDGWFPVPSKPAVNPRLYRGNLLYVSHSSNKLSCCCLPGSSFYHPVTSVTLLYCYFSYTPFLLCMLPCCYSSVPHPMFQFSVFLLLSCS